MKENSGVLFSLGRDNEPVNGCTISKTILSHGDSGVVLFTLAKDSDISPEQYTTPKLFLCLEGDVHIVQPGPDTDFILKKQDAVLVSNDNPVGVYAAEDSVLLEFTAPADAFAKAMEYGEVFKLDELAPFRKEQIVNRDLITSGDMKFVLMAMDEHTELAEHIAPKEVLLFGLEGEGEITCEGKKHTLLPGENFKFAAHDKHAVKAVKPFKMALLMDLDK